MQTAIKNMTTPSANLTRITLPNRLQFALLSVVSVLTLSIVGCSSSKPAPVIERNPIDVSDAARVNSTAAAQVRTNAAANLNANVPALDSRPRDPNAKIHVVKAGDSLYAIAFQNGLDYRELAAWNNLENVNKIKVGQELRLNAPSAGLVAATAATTAVPSVGGVAQLPAVAGAQPATTGTGAVSTPLVSAPGPSVGVPSGALELQAAQNAAANSAPNTATLKVEPKISKQPYSDAAYNRALQQVGGATSPLQISGAGSSGTGIVVSGRPTGGLSATSGAQPPLTGLPSLPPSTGTSTTAGATLLGATPTKITVAPPVADAAAAAAQAARTAAASASAAASAAAAAAQRAANANVVDAATLSGSDMPAWIWPLAIAGKPRITATFTDLNKGIDLPGAQGQGVLAAAAGKVVYSGTAMRGYGQLVIVKHNVAWFSAYAHNDKILVAEGDVVKKGQKIAEMGATDADSVKLHFEIRKQGVPVDPLKFLPPL